MSPAAWRRIRDAIPPDRLEDFYAGRLKLVGWDDEGASSEPIRPPEWLRLDAELDG